MALLVSVVGLMTACGGCEPDEPSTEPQKKAEKVKEVDAAKSEEPAVPREAFGVPFPPEVQTARVNDVEARVLTRLSIDEVESFYRLRLTDFEFVPEASHRLRIYGLHEHQPNIEVIQRTPKSDTRLWIRPKPHNYKVAYDTIWGEAPDGAEDSGTVAADGSGAKPRKGQPVKTILPSGEELAPGARWGEPYVPPEGSPLAHPRYKSNWGRPFGEWVLQ